MSWIWFGTHCMRSLKQNRIQEICNANVSTSRAYISSFDIVVTKVAPVSVPIVYILLRLYVPAVKVQWQEALMVIKGKQLPKSINNSCWICLCLCWLVFYAPSPMILAMFFKITLDFLHWCLRLLIALIVPCFSWHLISKSWTLWLEKKV